MTRLGADWVPDKDGVPRRRAARVILLSPHGKVLLLHGHDGDDAEHQWWFTVGGGLEPGETPRQGAVRELAEETGIVADPAALVGPVIYREAAFEFRNVLARQDEWFYLLHLEDSPSSLDASGRTAAESELVDGHGWFGAAALDRLAKEQNVWPRALPQLLAQWREGWDGQLARITEHSAGPGGS